MSDAGGSIAHMGTVASLTDLARLCVDLGAADTGELSQDEVSLIPESQSPLTADALRRLRQTITRGGDPPETLTAGSSPLLIAARWGRHTPRHPSSPR